MQLKGIIRFFTIVLIVVCLLQLSYTLYVRKHRNRLIKLTDKELKASYPSAEEKYAANSAEYYLYKDTLERTRKAIFNALEIKDKNAVVGYDLTGKVTYGFAKQKELQLGLDLQGGMAVTLGVGVDELVRKRSLVPTDDNLNKAISLANERKAKTGSDFLTLFVQAYREVTGGGKLAPMFANSNLNKLGINDGDDAVTSWLRGQISEALQQTRGILEKRVNAYGISGQNINLDEAKEIITVELAGVNNPEAVERSLTATARLQFWECYKNPNWNAMESIEKANNIIARYNNANLFDSLGKAKDTSDITKTKPFTTLFVRSGSEATLGRIQDTAVFGRYMNIPGVKEAFPQDLKLMLGKEEVDKGKSFYPVYPIRVQVGVDEAPLEGDKVSEAKADNNAQGQRVVNIKFNDAGSIAWENLTDKAYKEKNNIAITLDGVVYSAPVVRNGKISGGNTEISGDFSQADVLELANVLKTGKLDAPSRILQKQIVGPSLGAETVNKGMWAFVIAFGVIFLLMLVYYNTSGWVANIALILNLLFTVGVLSAFGFTLTAAGIAGLILTIGMAVDTNVIIFERIKEELTKGKNYQLAVEEGYKRSLPPVLDAHVTSFLTAAILFTFGLGPVLGFATTQMIGIVLSLFCGILFSRLLTDWWTKKNRHFEYFTGISRRIFKHAKFKFIEYRKYAYMISVVVLLAGVAAIFNGFHQGVEYKGGRSYVLDFGKKIDRNALITALEKGMDNEIPVVKTVDGDMQYDITTSYLIRSTDPSADAKVEQKLYELTKPFLADANTTYEKFKQTTVKGSKKVEPSISEGLKKGAIRSGIIAIIIISLYIFIRFRDWRYSVGTIVALLHDVFVTLAVFSFLKNIVPFPLEIDQHFIAAILTVVGFSMNDTVIVFDRVREYAKQKKGASKGEIINTAINDTLSRTIMTSLTVFLTILILFIFGGEVTRGFAFAMLVGVITGTYSSIFVAAPILVDFAKNKPLGNSGDDVVESGVSTPKP
jgi:SecD/SecF fusion protein